MCEYWTFEWLKFGAKPKKKKKKTGIKPREIKNQQIGNEVCHIL